MATEPDFYETPDANKLADAYQTEKHKNVWLIFVCVFLALYI